MSIRWLPCLAFALLLFVVQLTNADITASNTTTEITGYQGTIEIESDPDGDGQGSGTDLAELVPLTSNAVTTLRDNSPLQGNLVYTTPQTAGTLQVADVAYISCNPTDYSGNIDADGVLKDAIDNHNISAVILYSTSSDYCGYNNASSNLDNFPLYSMMKRSDSQSLLDTVKNMTSDKKYFVNIERSGSDNNQSGQQSNGNGQNPLGPSPSTAVAMIILYSITGIITALFLVIIITGAIRAHRHPDRYGPRDVLGRPRQSRAKGLGRAILDTLPIVKFGDRESPKPTDVEMGSTAEARNVENGDTETGAQQHGVAAVGTETARKDSVEARRNIHAEDQPSGIAPAETIVPAAAAQETATSDESLGCSICTEDFEKGQDIRVLPCDHKFHPECVDPWLLNVSGTCPLCRVDLRPTTSHTSAGDDDEQDPNSLAPPLQPEQDMSHRRRSAFRDILSMRSRPDASSEERISALRRLREQRRNHSGDVAGSANASEEDVAAQRRSRRISVRLSDVFHSRSRRRDDEHDAPPPPVFGGGESSTSQRHGPGEELSPVLSDTRPGAEEHDAQRRS